MRPMLAVQAPADLTFPLYASAKLDGVRAIIQHGLCLSRKMIQIPNEYIQSVLGVDRLNGLDGELTVGPPNAPDVMQRTMSAVMTRSGQPEFVFWVFDFWTAPDMPFAERLQIMQRAERDNAIGGVPYMQLLPQMLLHSAAELAAYERATLEQGFEGVMVRKPRGLYKYGRSTAKEAHLLKVKRFVDGEALVIGVTELMHNGNTATVDNVGNSKRSTNSEGMMPMGTLGALNCVDSVTGASFSIGTGFKEAERQHIWDNAMSYMGKYAVYKHFEQAGVKDAPRFPVFKGFRDTRDMS